MNAYGQTRDVGESTVPVWYNGRQPFLRKEEDDLWMVFPPKNPRPHFLNETAVFVLERCNGDNNVPFIIQQLSTEYPDVQIARLESDTINCMSFLKTLGLICWDDETYMRDEVSVIKNIDESPRLKMAGERDFGRIAEFVQQYYKEMSEGNLHKAFHLLTPADVRRSNYDDITIRTRQFHMVESFYCLEKTQELQGVCSMRMASSAQDIVSFVLLAVRDAAHSKQIYKALLNKTLFNLRQHRVYRVKMPLIPASVNDEVEEFLKELGFDFEATLLDELGQGQDLALWSIKIV